MSEFINTIDILGDDAVTDAILEGTLTEFKDNVVSKLTYFAFTSCTDLYLVDTPNLTAIAGNAFGLYLGGAGLTHLILRNTTICSLANTSAFTKTPIANGTGYIYVPSALYDQYIVATNWSTFSAQFRKLEEYTVDGTVDGDLDESKI